MEHGHTDFSLDDIKQITERIERIIFRYNFELSQFSVIGKVSCLDTDNLLTPESLRPLIFADDWDALATTYKKLVANPLTTTLEFRVKNINGGHHVLFLSVTSIFSDNSLLSIGGFVEDISERRRYEENLNEYSARKNSVLEIVKHDIAGQLAMVKNIAEFLALHADEQPKREIVHQMQLIKNISSESINIISDFVKDEHLTSAEMPLNIVRFDVVKRTRDIVDTYRHSETVLFKKVDYHSNSESVMIEGDDVKLMQVVINLISNSIKFSHDEGKIHISLLDQSEIISISVRDHGIGIPEQLKARIFEKLTPSGRPGLKGEKSGGMGLFICKKMIDRHGGKLWFESKENEGTTFFMEIPKFQPKILIRD